jgi:DNA sulfur modification protein DndD
VILDTIVLNNFAIYGGRQEVLLTPTCESKPIILFGGLNGGGKTTLIDAIQLAFYGPKARCSSRGKLSYSDFLRSTIHRGTSLSEGASIEVRFRRAVDGVTRSYAITRSWRESERGIEEKVKVLKDGEIDQLLAQHWEEYIENYIPSGIAHLFFFDAEQIKELAEGEHAAELLGTAIQSLLGLDLVDRLQTNLVALERRKRTESRTGEGARRAKKVQQDVERLQEAFDQAVLERGVIQNHADQLEKAHSKCAEKFRLEGGELFERRSELESDKVRLRQQLAIQELSLRELAGGASPLLLVADLLKDAEEQVRREAERNKSEVLVGALEDRDAKVLSALRAQSVPKDALQVFEKILSADRKSRKSDLSEPPFLRADDHVATELRHLRATVLPEQAARIHEKFSIVSDLGEKLSRLEIELARVPDEALIAGLQRELQNLQGQFEQKLAEVAAQVTKIDFIGRQLAAAQAELKRELGEDVDHDIAEEEQNRVVKHSAKVRATLSKFRTAIIRKHTARIESLMLDSFHQLLRKRSLISELSIDPETFRIELKGGDGQPLPFDQLSSGERQLLATSLLWGLARACGRPLPTIIDTPLGRLDSSHRKHLIERYFPVASHQVILLSTDEEIDESNLSRLQPFIGRTYYLRFDETLRKTSIQPGYFWPHEAAN